MVATAAELALNQFIEVSDRLSELESRINIPSAVPPTLSILNVCRDEIREVWVRIKKEYDACTVCLVAAGESAADSLPVLKAKYGYCYSAFERCGAANSAIYLHTSGSSSDIHSVRLPPAII
ncbi:hypothetical protein KR084_000674, partial [Drosophila pseudotakahashii]